MAIASERRQEGSGERAGSLELTAAATMDCGAVLKALGSSPQGLSSDEAQRRLAEVGPNALRSHGARRLAVLARQFKNPLLILLIATALLSAGVGETTNAVIILSIIGLSVGLGFVNEYRSERAVEALHSQLRHTALTLRDGKPAGVDVTALVPGDVVELAVGDVVPADLRLLRADDLECDESVLSGEAIPAEKRVEPIESAESPLALPPCAFMGTVVKAGSGRGVVTETGARTAFGAIAMRLGDRQPETAFQAGLRQYSTFLVRVTAVMAVGIFVVNIALGRDTLESLLFALSIAVGMTPQLLPAIETVSLSSGARRLAKHKVIVKRLVAIEDLGDIEVLFTDKTGTLTEGRITFDAALDTAGRPSDAVLRDGLECNAAVRSDGQIVGGTPLDRALWESPEAETVAPDDVETLAALPHRPAGRILRLPGRRGHALPGDRRARQAAVLPRWRRRPAARPPPPEAPGPSPGVAVEHPRRAPRAGRAANQPPDDLNGARRLADRRGARSSSSRDDESSGSRAPCEA